MTSSPVQEPRLRVLLKEMNDLADSYQTRGGADSHLFAFFERLPMPAWIKVSSGFVVRTNRAYADRYGISSDRYEADAEFSNELTAIEYSGREINVVHEGEPIFCIKEITNPETGEQRTLFQIEWPLEIEFTREGELPLKDMGATGGFVVADMPRKDSLSPGEVGAEILIKPDMRWVMRAPNDERN